MVHMPSTTLTEKLKAAGARIADYRGADTAAVFSGTAQEFNALRSGCGVFDLGWRAKLLITGSDRQKWLNGMVTNNIRDLAAGHGNYDFLLNAQGHILGDMYLHNRGDYILLDTDSWQAPKLRETLDHFIIMDDVEVADAGDKLTAIGLQGPKASQVLSAAGIAPPSSPEPLHAQDATWREIGITVLANEHGGFELWLASGNAPKLWDAMVAAGATPVGSDALELWRIASGIPRYGQDIRERDLPQETAQARALNFAKGCYVGQEIVERIRSRGAVHRQFTGFEIEGPPPASGTKLQSGGKDVGELTSVATLPDGRTVALGYIRREATAAGTVLTASGAQARSTELPFALEPALKH
jgi:folate-binding protein YgfZ